MKKIINITGILLVTIFLMSSCINDFLDFTPEDKVTSAMFPQTEADVKMLLNGVYANLRETEIYNQGLFGFGILDGATPNAYNWADGMVINNLGKGNLITSAGGIVTYRWTRCFSIISRANLLLSIMDEMDMSENEKNLYIGEAHFLRGLAYSKLVEAYGGVPIVPMTLTTVEALTLSRASVEETWDQVISDYDVAISRLGINAPEVGRATKGAALAMKMRAYLYQGKYQQVISVADEIEALSKYALFPSYEGLFMAENENNVEVIFDIQYIEGENDQGSFLDQYNGTGTGSWTRGSRYVPTDYLINAYENIDGSPTVPFDPNDATTWEGRDPRLAFTVVLPHSFILGHQFPNYIYPGGAFNHAGNPLKHLGTRKYRVQDEDKLPPAGQSYLNNIVIRYADVLLSKAEALIESGGDIPAAIALINRIRTERDDVKITPLPTTLSREEARTKLRNERRIEFALEGLYWMDIRRWDICDDIYPLNIYDHQGNVIETRFPNGYQRQYQLLPIPDSELSMNQNLVQNPGW